MVVVILGWMKKGRSIVTALELPCGEKNKQSQPSGWPGKEE